MSSISILENAKFISICGGFHSDNLVWCHGNAGSKYTKPVLLIIDEWLLIKLNDQEVRNLFEVISKRRKHSSTIFCSQFLEEGWYDQLGGEGTLADAIMDRISYDSYKINIVGIDPSKDISMREVYGLDPAEAQ